MSKDEEKLQDNVPLLAAPLPPVPTLIVPAEPPSFWKNWLKCCCACMTPVLEVGATIAATLAKQQVSTWTDSLAKGNPELSFVAKAIKESSNSLITGLTIAADGVIRDTVKVNSLDGLKNIAVTATSVFMKASAGSVVIALEDLGSGAEQQLYKFAATLSEDPNLVAALQLTSIELLRTSIKATDGIITAASMATTVASIKALVSSAADIAAKALTQKAANAASALIDVGAEKFTNLFGDQSYELASQDGLLQSEIYQKFKTLSNETKNNLKGVMRSTLEGRSTLNDALSTLSESEMREIDKILPTVVMGLTTKAAGITTNQIYKWLDVNPNTLNGDNIKKLVDAVIVPTVALSAAAGGIKLDPTTAQNSILVPTLGEVPVFDGRGEGNNFGYTDYGTYTSSTNIDVPILGGFTDGGDLSVSQQLHG